MNTADENRATFVRWTRINYPDAYRAAVSHALSMPDAAFQPGLLSGLLDSITSTFEKFAKVIPDIASTYTNTKAQLDWLKINAQRAAQGLPPLDPLTGQPIAAQTVSPPAVNSHAAVIENQLVASANTHSGIPGWVWIAGAALVGTALL